MAVLGNTTLSNARPYALENMACCDDGHMNIILASQRQYYRRFGLCGPVTVCEGLIVTNGSRQLIILACRKTWLNRRNE